MNLQGSSPSRGKGSTNFDLFIGGGWDEGDLSLKQFRIVAHISRWSSGGRWCDSSVEQMSKVCKIGRNNIKPTIVSLEGKGIIEVKRRCGRFGGNRYRIIDPAVSTQIPLNDSAVSETTVSSISFNGSSIQNEHQHALPSDTPLPPLPKPITKPTIDGLVDKFGVGGGKEQTEEEQVVQLIKAQGVSGKVATDLASQPGCTRKLVQRAIDDMPREARNPPGMLFTKIKTRLYATEAKKQEAMSRPKRQKTQKDESKPPTEEERAFGLAQFKAFKEKHSRPGT